MRGFVSGQSLSYKAFLGRWKGQDEKRQTGAIMFLDSLRLNLSFMGAGPMPMYYRMDLSSDPVKLDLYRDPARKGVALKSLIQLVDSNTIKWEVFPGGERPEKFVEGPASTLVVLTRKN